MGFKVQKSVFGKMVTEYRKQNHLTQQELSDKSKVNIEMIRQYEHNRRDVGMNHFVRLMNAMGFDVKVYIRGHGKDWTKISYKNGEVE